MNTTIVPNVTPQQQMALAWRGFSLPEGTEVEVVTARGVQRRTKVWTLKLDDPTKPVHPIEWVEAIGRDSIDAVNNLVREVSRP